MLFFQTKRLLYQYIFEKFSFDIARETRSFEKILSYNKKVVNEVRRKTLKKYENKNNVIGNLIKEYRENSKLSKTEVSRQLQLHAVYIDRTELNRMEEGRMIVKDFELIALCKVLKIPFEKLSYLIE